MRTTDTTTATAVPRPGGATLAALLVGPTATVAAVNAAAATGALTTISPAVWMWVLLAFWSPLPFSIPALLLERHRDAALPGAPSPLRAVALLPWMLLSAQSTARVATAVSLAGFAAGVGFASL